MLSEVRNIERCCRTICKLPRAPQAWDMLLFAETKSFALGGRCYIVSLTHTVRALVIIFVVLPRTIIAFYLSELGCRWLSSSASFSAMVLNSLALGFVIAIDEQIYHSILPLATRKQIAETKFLFKEGPEPKDLSTVEMNEWVAYARSSVFFACVIIFVFLYGDVFQTVLPSDLHTLHQTCRSYTKATHAPV